ncbi:MAG: N-acetylmuramoyl-L-alanine amidase [Candidatus Accumulibacter sp. UW20]|jgi:N-acetylmuramoyl-L-alanine amidase
MTNLPSTEREPTAAHRRVRQTTPGTIRRAGDSWPASPDLAAPQPGAFGGIVQRWRGATGVGLLCAFLAGCSGLPVAPGERTVVVPSPNHNARRPNFVVLHDTASGTVERALKVLTDPARSVSAHYLIGRDGTLYQLVDEDRRAWHAGASWWAGQTDLNSASIGIELDNTGAEPYPEAQIVRLLEVLKGLKERYRIPASNFIGHGDVAPRRKVDPSRYFPWQRLASEGFGLWCRENALVALPDPADPADPADPGDQLLALEVIGYDVSNPAAALAAFRRHFLGTDAQGEVSAAERQLMRCLAREKRPPAP